ncbi:MAG TPA: UvrD-helicase domain-containing protein [Steroidobacteraceae bacterium]|nr:UvrD-helicase domain-containing protein [Steroidobacteraceae bacterium]
MSDRGDQDRQMRLDAEARAAALDPSCSLLLQAPAGSGKTTVLAARFLTLLTAVQSPEEILAITFTRKAAAEMRHRILAALQAPDTAEARPGLPAALLQAVRRRDAQLGWQLLHNGARLRVETIDALNARLARTLPVAARCAPDLRVTDAPGALYELAARRALQGAWSDAPMRSAAELLLDRLDNDWQRLQRLLARMLEHRSHWLPRVLEASGAQALVQRVHESLDALIGERLAAARATLPSELLQEGAALVAHARREPHSAAVGLDAQAASLPQWRALGRLALKTDGQWRRRFDAREGFGAAEAHMKPRVQSWVAALAREPGARELLRELLGLPDARLPADDEAGLMALARLLVYAAAQLQLAFADSGRVDFPYLAGAARESLSQQGEPSDTALRTGESLRHILVDEFQDTSYEQYKLLQALTVGWEPGDGRTLFLVGDPMQSIYQFREADVGLFLQARDHGLGRLALRPLQLRRNFRCGAPLLAWINRSFGALFPATDDVRRAAVRYLPSVPAEEPAQDPRDPQDPQEARPAAVTLHRFDAADRRGEAQAVLRVVRAERARARGASIAVLVASREHATFIAAALREAGVPLRGVELEPLRERPVVRDLAALTRVLLHRADRTAWLALLRAPWCALTLEELDASGLSVTPDPFGVLQAAAAAGAETAPARVPAVLRRLCVALEPALQRAERALPLWRRVEHCWLRLAGPAVYPSSTDRDDARRFLDALARHGEPDTLAGEALDTLLEQLYSSEPPQPDAVEIMTVHAAKGLEWDVVILPQLGRQAAIDMDPLLHWIELPRPGQPSELLLAPIRAGEHEPAGSLGAYIKRLRRERARLERVRLLYVAATRARRSLHLLGALSPPRAPAMAARPAADSMLALLWAAIGTQFMQLAPGRPAGGTPGDTPGDASSDASSDTPAAAVAAAEEVERELPHSGPLRRLAAHWQLPPPPPAPRPLRLQLPAAAEPQQPEYSWVGLAARAVGTIVHAELHRFALGGLPVATELPGADAYGSWLAELGVQAAERAAAAERITRALQRTLEDPQGRWLLSGAHREAHSEWRLTGLHQGRVVNVILDRMLIDERGERWIVDFKTSTHEGGSLTQFMEAQMLRYRAQLLRYAALARELGPEPVRVGLYFPLLGQFRELALHAIQSEATEGSERSRQ